jgi:hypothetical protein
MNSFGDYIATTSKWMEYNASSIYFIVLYFRTLDAIDELCWLARYETLISLTTFVPMQ